MRKIINIDLSTPYVIICTFENGEIRNLDLEKVLDKTNKYAIKIFNEKVFKTGAIGENGEILWENTAEIKTIEGDIIPCAYDICPDFAYINSTKIELESANKIIL